MADLLLLFKLGYLVQILGGSFGMFVHSEVVAIQLHRVVKNPFGHFGDLVGQVRLRY